MKTITIELTDKQHCLLSRIAKADKRKLDDFIYLIIAEGLTYFFCERQQAKNEKLQKTKGWDDLEWDILAFLEGHH
tara:strand:- start:3260 stop:3487 length:228 start_codon:yes stop_codon:yes gene_type:complete